ncbi:hypothetical protein F66182_2938 [Fusarium sp. NRRL 66182]|nr:hypothetical protein F66182_2938 [Fusarium sp. NRRL 66182]
MFGERIRGPGMIILQVLRALTLISLLAAAIGCWILIIKIDTSSGWFFFDALSLTFTSSASVFLIVSELPFCQNYFRENWPVFSDQHGLTWLGIGLILIGSNILGRLHQPSNSSDELGLPFWRAILASGILTLTSGVLNMICSLIFRDGANDINARMVRADGSLAKGRDEVSLSKSRSDYTPSSFSQEKPRKNFMSVFWNKGEDEARPGRPHISQPITHDHDVERHAMPHYDHHHDDLPDHRYGQQRPDTRDRDQDRDDESLDRRSPIMPEVRRPDTALHPIHARANSLYSAAHMSRF